MLEKNKKNNFPELHTDFNNILKKSEIVENKLINYYSGEVLKGKTIQYQIYEGINLIYYDLEFLKQEIEIVEPERILSMNYCISGRCEFPTMENKFFYIGEGDFSILNNQGESKARFHYFSLGKYSGVTINFQNNRIDKFLSDFFPNTKITSETIINKLKGNNNLILLGDNLKIKNIFEEMLLIDSQVWREKIIIKLIELILYLVEIDIESNENKGKYFNVNLVRKIKQIKKTVTEDIENYIKIKDITEKYNISQRTFSECFKAIYGKTYYSFVKEYRIQTAAEMLKNTDQSVAEIAISVGYQNASKFSRAFSDIMGISPLSFRKNNFSSLIEKK